MPLSQWPWQLIVGRRFPPNEPNTQKRLEIRSPLQRIINCLGLPLKYCSTKHARSTINSHVHVAPKRKPTIHALESKHLVHDEFFDGPILVAAVGQISSDFDWNFPFPKLLHSDLQRVRFVLDVHHHRRVHAVRSQRNRHERHSGKKAEGARVRL